MLDRLDVSYSKQHIINGKFVVDAYYPDQRIVVQFDGDYWHGHPENFPQPDKRQKTRMKLDRSQDAYMRKCGYTIIRFWETDINQNLENCFQRLQSVVSLPISDT